MKKQKPLARSAGVLFPVFSLPSCCENGTFGSEAYRFIDFLNSANQTYWQVLPLTPAGYGDSPYQSYSAFAGNPLYISPEFLASDGLISYKEEKKEYSDIDYEKAYRKNNELLKTAFKNFRPNESNAFTVFCIKNSHWLDNYAVFMAFKKYFNDKPWYEWDEEIKFRVKEPVNRLADKLSEDILFHKFCQYKFHSQWFRLKEYANKRNIKIIGDIPIYVSYDSADVWASPELFMLDSKLVPRSVAGVPPDMFSQTGQLWGNPLYDWNAMEHDDFKWWRKRISHTAELYDVIRIDHFIGMVNFYSIPYGEKNALNGVWLKGPGEALIKAINESRGNTAIIAEDLGPATKEVIKVLKKSGYPGMKLMEFAFDDTPFNENLPHNFDSNCVVYGGTHDNETLCGYFSGSKKSVVTFAKSYLNVAKKSDIPWGIIRSAYASNASVAIFQLQDYLSLDNTARINTPSTVGINWKYRLPDSLLTDTIAKKIKDLTQTYARSSKS